MPRDISSLSIMSIKTFSQNNLTWINIDKIDEESLSYLKKNYQFHHLDYEDLLSEQQVPRIDSYPDYLFIILKFPYWQEEENEIIEHEVDIFVGNDFLITIQHSQSKEIKDFFYRCMNNRKIKEDWLSSPGVLLYRLIDGLFENTGPILNHMGKEIDNLEHEIYQGAQGFEIIKKLSIYRRNILHFRRIIDPQKYLINNLSNIKRSFIDESLKIYFDDISDDLNKIWTVIETYKETINGLHVTVESFINRRTSKLISSLTVISVSLLPLNLLAGMYGMNIDKLPFARNPILVWLMFGLFGGLIILIILIMRKKKML